MNFYKNRKLQLLATLIFVIGLCWGELFHTQIFGSCDGLIKCSVYGTVTDKEYQAQENHLGFYENQAFPGDNAYNRTIIDYGREKFCAAEPTIHPKASGAFRIMSFNVHNFHKICAQNGEIKKHPQYAVKVIEQINPDIVALQEIVPYVRTESNALAHLVNGVVDVDFSILDTIMHNINFTYNIKVNDFEQHLDQRLRQTFMGKAFYTKSDIPIKDFFVSQVGHSLSNDRGYIRILFEYEGKRILLYNVHLTFFNEFLTTMEINELVGFIKKDKERYETENVVIIGDFNNNPYTDPQIFSSLKKESYVLLNDAKPTAFNQNAQTGETIDLIYVSNGFLDNFEILNKVSDLSGDKWVVSIKSDASDHWPIFFDFRSKKYLDDAVNRIFETLKRKLFKSTLSLCSSDSFDSSQVIPDVELNEAPISLPIQKEIKSQSINQMKVYKGIEVIDKKTIADLLLEIKEGYLKFSREQGVSGSELKEPNLDYLSKVVLNVLHNEISLNKDYYVAYHAHKPEYTFLFDVFQQIYRWGLLNNSQQLSLRLIRPCEFKNSKQTMETFLSQASLLTRTHDGDYVFDGERSKHLDQIQSVSSLLLSLNLSLFANMKNPGASSLILALAGKSFRKINTEEILSQILKDCNIGEEFIPKILRLKQQFLCKQKRGVLLQFFFKKDAIDNFAYLANVGGRPVSENIMPEIWGLEKNRVSLSLFLDDFINKPYELNTTLDRFIDEDQRFVFNQSSRRSLGQIQARLWLPAQEIYNPHFVKVKRYNLESDDYVSKEYYMKLNGIFEEIIKDIIRKKLLDQIGFHDLAETPLEMFEQEVASLIAEEKEKIYSRTQTFNNKKATPGIPSFQAEIEQLIYCAGQQETIDSNTAEKIKSALASPLFQKTLTTLPKKITPLIMAVKMNKISLVRLLFSIDGYDPDINAKSVNGQTALYWAKMNVSNTAGKEIFEYLIKQIQDKISLLDSTCAIDLAILSKVDSIRPVVLKKFEEKLFQASPDIVSIGKELIKNSSMEEFNYITKKLFFTLENAKTHQAQSTSLNLLKFSVMRENQDSEIINKAFDFSMALCESKVLVVKKTALDLQNSIGKKLIELHLGSQREKYYLFQEYIYQLDAEKIEQLFQQAKKMIQSCSADAQDFAILIFDAIIRNYRANKRILDEAFLVIKQFVDSPDVSRQIDIINLFQPLMYLGDPYEQQIRYVSPTLIQKIYTKTIESEEKFNHLQVWQQKKLLHGLLNILEHLINRQVLDASFLLIAEKIINKVNLQNQNKEQS